MSESDFVTAVNANTGLVATVPRSYLVTYPQYQAVTEVEIVELRRAQELEMFGEYKTPAPHKAKAAKADAPAKEGGK